MMNGARLDTFASPSISIGNGFLSRIEKPLSPSGRISSSTVAKRLTEPVARHPAGQGRGAVDAADRLAVMEFQARRAA